MNERARPSLSLGIRPETGAFEYGTRSAAVQASFDIPGNHSIPTYKVSKVRQRASDMTVCVSGSNAQAGLNGTLTFVVHSLESSSAYRELKAKYNLDDGVNALFDWLNTGTNASTRASIMRRVCHELSSSVQVNGTMNVDISVRCTRHNDKVCASVYVFSMKVEDTDGNEFFVASGEAHAKDTVALDQNGIALAPDLNNTTITL